MKPLLPTLKEKKRYVVYNAISDAPITKKACEVAIETSLSSYIGTLGLAQAGIRFLDWQEQKGIVRVAHTHVSMLKAAFTLITNIGNTKTTFSSVAVSGLLKKARQEVKNNGKTRANGLR